MPGRGGRVDVVLVVGGRWHDFDSARLQLLLELAEHDVVRVRVFEDYDCLPALEAADTLVTYTCDVRPNPTAQAALVSFVERGGRWLALHATNSAIDREPPSAPYRYSTPRVLGPVAQLLGSQFLGHPPSAPYTVTVDQPDHPLVRGISPFVTTDELYVSELHPPLTVLLSTRFTGASPSFVEGDAEDDEPRPVLYLKATGSGCVCYFTLGHCRSRFDVQDLGIDDWGRTDRGSWEVPEFRTVLGRALGWAVHGEDWSACRRGAAW